MRLERIVFVIRWVYPHGLAREQAEIIINVDIARWFRDCFVLRRLREDTPPGKMTCHRPFDVNVVVQRRRRQRTNFPPSRSRRRKRNDRGAKSVDCVCHSFAVKWCRVCMNKCAFFFITSQHGEKSPLLLLKICPFLLHFLSVRRRRKRKRKNQTNPDELLGVVLLRPKIIENNDKKRLEPRSGKSGSVTVRFDSPLFFLSL